MKTHLLLSIVALLALGQSALSVGPPPLPGGPADAVVKITATIRTPNPVLPWTPTKSREVSGTGAVVAGNKILTNAHVVNYAVEVHVQIGAGGDKFEAKVESIAQDMDLAVLRVSDKKFFQKRTPLAFAPKMPNPGDAVEVYGFPIGGAEMSVTKGVVSRVGYTQYPAGGMGLVIQTSAAVNPGNSGGPAVVDGKMIGLVFSMLRGANNIGYIIPNEEIHIFLEDVKDGRYDGKPRDATATQYQTTENEALRAMLKLQKGTHGLLAVPPRHPDPGNPFAMFDVITRIGNHDLDINGMVRLANGVRIPFRGMIPRVAHDNAVEVSVLRKGKRLKLSLPVTTKDNKLIRALRGEQPSYFIHGTLAFSPLRQEVADVYLQRNPSLRPRQFARARFPGEELVVVTAPMFEHKIAKGYDDPVGHVLSEVNGKKVKNLRHLVEILRDSKDEFLQFRFAEEGTEILVFRRTEMNKATAEVLDDAGIAPSRRGSKDMLKVWNSGAGKDR